MFRYRADKLNVMRTKLTNWVKNKHLVFISKESAVHCELFFKVKVFPCVVILLFGENMLRFLWKTLGKSHKRDAHVYISNRFYL